MHSAKRTRTRTRSVTAKVTPQEETVLRGCAETEGLTLSEWSRKALLDCAQTSAETRLLLSELMALRTAFLTIHTEVVMQGQALTKDRLTQVVNAAETTKFAAADKRIQAFARLRKTEAAVAPEEVA